MSKTFRIQGLIVSLLFVVVIGVFAITSSGDSAYDLQYSSNLGKGVAMYFVAMLLLFFGPVSDISVLAKFKIALSLTIGMVVVGLVVWQIIAPASEFDVSSIALGSVSLGGFLILLTLSFFTASMTTFLVGKNGADLASCAVPIGLGACAVRMGELAITIGSYHGAQDIHSVYFGMSWEGFAWLLLVLIGIAGANVGIPFSLLRKRAASVDKKSVGIAIVISVLVGMFGTNLLAIGARVVVDREVFSVTRQAYTGQVCFAVLISFIAAGFLCRHFFKVHYIVPVISTAFVVFITMIRASRMSDLEYLGANFPSSFFVNSFAGILPIQMVAFGSLGAMTGYWFSVLLKQWHKENS